jgi:F-box protein 11
MNDDRLLGQAIASSYDATAPSREPAGLLDDILLTTGRSRQRPRWLALTKEPPMRLPSGVAVGSPTARLATLAVATILLVILATGAVVAGSNLLAGSAPIIVASDGSGDHASIVDAVAAAVDGDTILVRPGTYPGTVVIDKDIILRGDGPREEVVIEFGADSPVIQTEWAALPYGILLADTTATVSDLSIHGPNVATAFVVVGGAPTIERVTTTLEGEVGDQPHSGVGLIHGASPTIREAVMDGPVWNLGGPIVPEYDAVQGTGGVTVIDSVIDYGIWAQRIDGGSVTGNTVTNGGIQVSMLERGSAEVSGNAASSISFDGDGTGITVRENDLRGGSELGVAITLGPGSPTIERNDIVDVEVGISVPPDATPTIRSNLIDARFAAIVISGGATGAVIEGNQLCGNQFTVRAPDTFTLDPSNDEVCPASASG